MFPVRGRFSKNAKKSYFFQRPATSGHPVATTKQTEVPKITKRFQVYMWLVTDIRRQLQWCFTGSWLAILICLCSVVRYCVAVLPKFEVTVDLTSYYLLFLNAPSLQKNLHATVTAKWAWGYSPICILCYMCQVTWSTNMLVHGQVTIIFVVSVCLSVWLCRVFFSRLWSDFDKTRTCVICLGLVVSPRI